MLLCQGRDMPLPEPSLTIEAQEHEMGLPNPLIVSDPERQGGTPVFAGTRVPVRTLFDHIETGDPLDVFLDDFPDVSREHAIAVCPACSRLRQISCTLLMA
jgi:uncharacterized protein (DUF433 family)